VPLFGRTRGKRPRVLSAAGVRLDLANRESVRALATSRTAQGWQSDAWGYRDMIGELRFAGQFKARAVARVKYFPAQVVPDEDEPLPFDADEGVTVSPALQRAAVEELSRLPLDAGYRFLGVLDENLSIAGECWLHGYQDDADEEQWEVLSVSEVFLGQDGMITIRRHGEGVGRTLDPDGAEEMLRLWVPHPRWGNLADSPMRALQDVCEDIVLHGREMRAVSRSRIASNGLFKIPRGLALLLATRDDALSADDEGFMSELSAALTAPIHNEGHPSSVAPVGIIGDLEDLAGFDHVRIDREASEEIIGKVEQGLARLARGLDIPAEIITGMGDANHWTAWQIDSSTYRYHIDPSVRTVADSLTEAFLRPALLARGFTLAEVRQVMVWRDAGVLTENPNRGQDAKDAFDRGSIGFKALNNALGFTEADMPDDDELIKMVAMKTGVDTSMAGLLLRAALGTVVPDMPEPAAPRVIDAQRADRPEPTGPGQAPPDTPDATPTTAPPGITAAGRGLVDSLLAASEPRWDVHGDLSRALMDIDRALMDRLLVGAEEALERALEKAGARVRSKANGNPTVRASLHDVHVTRMAAAAGRDAVLALGLKESDLLAGAFDRLAANWETWVNAGIAQTIKVVLRLLGVKAGTSSAADITDRITNTMRARMPRAYARMADDMAAVAERVLYAPDEPHTGQGETSTFRIPAGIIRRALAEVGGHHPEQTGQAPELPSGIGTGDTVADVLTEHGAHQLGLEWVYGVADRNTFDPHYAFDGERFPSWLDDRLRTPAAYAWVGPYFHPGDHNGCQCHAIPLWVTPTADTDLAARPGWRDNLRALRDRWLRRDRG
jgi:hypothetical protein